MNFEYYMDLALHQAELARQIGEVPIGAVVVSKDGVVLAAAHNLVELNCTQTAHAELLALSTAGAAVGDWRLSEATLYVTLEPCAMCMAAIMLSRIKCLVYGASSPVFGYKVDKQISFAIYNFPIDVHEGVLATKAETLLRDFFEHCRRSNGG